MEWIVLISTVIASATPIVIAALGETISEKSGMINLSLDGTLLLCAMAAFAVSYETKSLIWGFSAAICIGATVALVIACFSLFLCQSQIAVGFVLTLMCKDLAYFLGNPYSRLQGLQIMPQPIPFLSRLPGLGPILFTHDYTVYFSLIFIVLCWWYIYKTSFGLTLRAAGEHPEALYIRGIRPDFVQMAYMVCGGGIVGLSGAIVSLSTKPGWGRPQGAEGMGWIILAIVIFGGWHPLKVALGAYLFAFLQVISISTQDYFPNIPAQVFQVLPFPVMIFTLVIMHALEKKVPVPNTAPTFFRKTAQILTGSAPTALGKPFRPTQY